MEEVTQRVQPENVQESTAASSGLPRPKVPAKARPPKETWRTEPPKQESQGAQEETSKEQSGSASAGPVSYRCRNLEFFRSSCPPVQEILKDKMECNTRCCWPRKRKQAICGHCRNSLIQKWGEDNFWKCYEEWLAEEEPLDKFNEEDTQQLPLAK